MDLLVELVRHPITQWYGAVILALLLGLAVEWVIEKYRKMVQDWHDGGEI